ncbi:Stress response protein YsnF [Metalysinibacillus saudimassiliensis]|uniref:Stress response protein YsnF n=1 Tax=Metalysinibacillus saudimassiliensis TaxID=1461583 RepID=A0A078MG51_9BACL|nr:Stress response protein YsnF [Metalysinibacillus saudimassiliensis]
MNNRDNKLYGIYDTEAEIQSEMDRLRAEGFTEEDMYIVSKKDNQYSMHRGFSDYDTTEHVSWWDRFKASLMGEDIVREQHFNNMGLTEEERLRYASDLDAGKYLLYVDKNYGTHYDNAIAASDAPTDVARTEEERLALHEEQLHVDKKRVQTGEVDVEKYVVEDQQTIEVPVEREEVYIERRPVNKEATALHDDDVTNHVHAYEENGRIHIPVTEEEVEVTKKDVIAEEIVIGKKKVVDTETVSETVRREEVDIHDSTHQLQDNDGINRSDRKL